MLRRSVKRATDSGEAEKDTQSKQRIRKRTKKFHTLGIKKEKDEAEKILENVVFGGQDDLVARLGTSDSTVRDAVRDVDSDSEKQQHKEKEAPKPVWEDEDDETLNIDMEKKKGMAGRLKLLDKKTVSGKQYAEKLKNQFEKVAGTPAWARLKHEKEEVDDGEGGDSDTEDLMKSTGNYLTAAEFLPKGILQFKQLANANKESKSEGKLKAVEFHPTAQVILTAGMGQTLKLFQVDGRNNPKIQSVHLDGFPILSAHFTADGEQVVMGSKHSAFYYYDMIAGKVVKVPKIKGLENDGMGHFEISPDGRFIVFLGKYGNMHLISAKSREWISSLKMNGSVESVAFSPDGSTMYSHGDDGQVYLWDMDRRQCTHKFYDDGCLKGTALAASKNGQYLACGSYSGIVNVYETSTLTASAPKPIKSIMNLTTPVTKAVFNATSEILALSSNHTERAVKLVHFPSMTVFSNFPDRTGNMRIPFCMDFSKHSGYFSIANHKGEALLYRLKHYANY